MSEPARPTAFFSYARADAIVVRAFAEQLRALGIDVLLDTEFLRPGERFERAIMEKVRSADALVFFVSPASLQSEWVAAELLAYSERSSKVVVPVLISGADFADLPEKLAVYQGIKVEDDAGIPAAVTAVARVLRRKPRFVPPPGEAELSPQAQLRDAGLAASIAADLRAPARDLPAADSSVFLVHGHDRGFRDEVRGYLQTLGIEPVILAGTPARGGARSLLDRFEELATRAHFAVVLMSPDDFGASRDQYESQADSPHVTLKYRARENVILELGFFYGRLGWDHVFVLQKQAPQRWPDFETPSDLAGAVILRVPEAEEREETRPDLDWRAELREALRDAELLGQAAKD